MMAVDAAWNPTASQVPVSAGEIRLDVQPTSGDPSVSDGTDGMIDRGVSDRRIDADGAAAWRAATDVSPISPATDRITDGDLNVRINRTPDGRGFNVVVLKPRVSGPDYEIPLPEIESPTGADLWRHVKDHLEAAADVGAGRVFFPADVDWRLDVPDDVRGTPPHVMIRGFTDTVILLNGATLRFGGATQGIRIVESERIKLTGGTIIGSGVIDTVAKVVSDSTNPAGFRLEVVPSMRGDLESQFGTADVPLVTVGAAVPDGDGWTIDRDTYAESFVNRSDGVSQFEYRDGSFVPTTDLRRGPNPFGGPDDPFTAAGGGDRYVFLQHLNNQGHGLFLDASDGLSDVSIQNVRFEHIPGMMIAGEVDRGLHIRRVTLAKSPESNVFAAASDAIHINAGGGDIMIVRNDLGANADDKINIKGNYWRVSRIDRGAGTVEVVPAGRTTSVRDWGNRGDEIVFIDGDFGVVGRSQLSEDADRGGGKRHVLTMGRVPDDVTPGTLVGNVTASNPRVVIRRNTLDTGRAQGVLVQSSHVTVNNNVFRDIAAPAVKLNQTLKDWHESVATRNVVIARNVFDRVGFDPGKPPVAVEIRQVDSRGREVDVIDDVELYDNTEINPPPLIDAVSAGSASGKGADAGNGLGAAETFDTVAEQLAVVRMDVSGDERVSAVDALMVLNAVRVPSSSGESVANDATASPDRNTVAVDGTTDIDGDGRTTPLDALMILNRLRRHSARPSIPLWSLADWERGVDLPLEAAMSTTSTDQTAV